MTGVVAVIPVGPGEREAARATRVVQSLAKHEPGLVELILVIDGITEAVLAPRLPVVNWPVTYLTNPRDGRGNGAFDGLACGLTAAYAVVARRHPGAHAWKIDTDALVLRRGSDQVIDYFHRHPRVGMTGTYSLNADGTPRGSEGDWWEIVSRRYLRPLWYWRSKKQWTSSWIGKPRRFARMMREANAKGLQWGWHVQGGSYAINSAVLACWLATGRLDRPTDWLGVPLGEDMCFSHWVVLDDFELADFNRPGEVFGVRNVGLPMPIDRLIDADYAVVHSVKTADWADECALVDELTRRTAGVRS